jgi:glycosyltransferase involved in cell wall biosynthesis
LARRGVDVMGLVDAADERRSPPPGCRTIALDHVLRGPLRTPRRVVDRIAGADLVVIHGGWLLGNIEVGRACRGARIPFVVTTHGVYVREVLERRALVKRLWAHTLERRHLGNAAAVHVFFPEEQASMERSMNVRVPTVTAPNGIDYPEGVRWTGDGGYLLWLGRFDPVTKGLDLLARAIARIPAERRPRLRLHGPDWRNHKGAVRDLVRELGIERWVTVGDPVYGDEKWSLIAGAAACVYPSRWDACPVAVSEAAAVGVPMLVTRYPLGSFLAARGAAIQVDPDPARIADAIPRLLADEGTDAGRIAATVARRHLSWEAVTASWLHQVQDLLA